MSASAASRATAQNCHCGPRDQPSSPFNVIRGRAERAFLGAALQDLLKMIGSSRAWQAPSPPVREEPAAARARAPRGIEKRGGSGHRLFGGELWVILPAAPAAGTRTDLSPTTTKCRQSSTHVWKRKEGTPCQPQ